MDNKEIIKEINKLRLDNKNNWYGLEKHIPEKNLYIKVKGFGTWLQVLNLNGINHSSCMDISVKKFKENIQDALNYHDDLINQANTI